MGKVSAQVLPVTTRPVASLYDTSLTITVRRSPGLRVTVPVMVGVVSPVIKGCTTGAAGAVLSMISSEPLVSAVLLPPRSVMVALTS